MSRKKGKASTATAAVATGQASPEKFEAQSGWRRAYVLISEQDLSELRRTGTITCTVQSASSPAAVALKSEGRRAYRQAYRQRPEVRAKQRAYRSERRARAKSKATDALATEVRLDG